jgi:hypothetical protein
MMFVSAGLYFMLVILRGPFRWSLGHVESSTNPRKRYAPMKSSEGPELRTSRTDTGMTHIKPESVIGRAKNAANKGLRCMQSRTFGTDGFWRVSIRHRVSGCHTCTTNVARDSQQLSTVCRILRVCGFMSVAALWHKLEQTSMT